MTTDRIRSAYADRVRALLGPPPDEPRRPDLRLEALEAAVDGDDQARDRYLELDRIHVRRQLLRAGQLHDR